MAGMEVPRKDMKRETWRKENRGRESSGRKRKEEEQRCYGEGIYMQKGRKEGRVDSGEGRC